MKKCSLKARKDGQVGMQYTYITGNDPRKNEFNRLTELTGGWEIIPEKTDIIAEEEDAKWIKDQVWLYYKTRPR